MVSAPSASASHAMATGSFAPSASYGLGRNAADRHCGT